MTAEPLPEGYLLSWYGDDFTGSAATMEALSFAGLPAVLFLAPPTPEQLAAFAAYRAIGIAGTARSRSPAWMQQNLPSMFSALKGLGAPITHYKICSTFDSAPEIGSIGAAYDLGAPILGGDWTPMMVAAPPIGRYQAFGNLFARLGETVHRLDRHPVMASHPVTPMHEADVLRHLTAQTDASMALVDLLALRGADGGNAALAEARGDAAIVALDAVDENDLAAAGRLIWNNRGERLFALGSQGFEYALIAYWRRAGLIPPPAAPRRAEAVKQVIAVSGSVSSVTKAQIAWSADNGFALLPFEAARVLDPEAREAAISDSVAQICRLATTGVSVLVHSASGPGDPAIARFRAACETVGVAIDRANLLLGETLGRILDRAMRETRLTRGIISGGDTSGHAAGQMGIHALTALAPTIPGAALCTAHAADGRKLELALKGGQMGSPDYFGWVRDGGGPKPDTL